MDAPRAQHVAEPERAVRIVQPQRDGLVDVRGPAVRLCAIEQPMLTIIATMRCAMKPGLSRHTVTGTPSEARSACAASRYAAPVTGVP